MDIPKGTVTDHIFTDSEIKPGSIHEYSVYIPRQYDPAKPAALFVRFDGFSSKYADVMDKLIAEGAMPVCIGLFSKPGYVKATLPGGADRSIRCPEYDGLGSDNADFIIEELLPAAKQEHNLNISESPDMHMICGCSSGGIAAFNAAWERNDFFRRTFIVSPTFSAFRGGDSLPVLMRKYETKPIRTYMTVGTDDMCNAAGNWHLEALAAADAMKYANYDFKFEVFEGGKHGCGFDNAEVIEKAFRFAWNDWAKPVRAPGLPPRCNDIISLDDPWIETSGKMPEPFIPACSYGTYYFEKGTVYLKHSGGKAEIAADGFGKISSLAMSPDRWRLYISDMTRRFVYVMSISPDGSLSNCYPHGHLHLADDCVSLGASAVCTDVEDRLYAATQLGIQTVDPNGHTNAVIPLPGHLPVTNMAFGGEDMRTLYAASGSRVFMRRIKVPGLSSGTPVMKPAEIPL